MNIHVPAPVDCQILKFKQLFKLKTLNDITKNVYKNPTQLVTASSLFELTFVGERCGIKVIVTSKVLEKKIPNLTTVLENYVHRNISLPSSPTHIEVNCEQKLLSVVFNQSETPVLRIYKIESFFQANVAVFSEVRLSSTNGTFVTDFSWNPSIPYVLSCCVSDGTLSVYTFTETSFEVKSLPKESCSTCACWSPKGKQIVVGNYNGFLTQYLPELKPVKNFEPPSGIFGKPCTLHNIKWLSSFQFICVYKVQQQYAINCEENTSVVVMNTPKNGPITYINYGDICFSSGSERPCQFYFIHISSWNLIFVASANAAEVAVLNLNQDGITWCQWNLDESAGIVLPICKNEETFPIGMAIDYSSQIQTPIDKNLVPMPMLNVLTSEGLLCVYSINYLLSTAPCICIKSQPVLTLDYFTSVSVLDENKVLNQRTAFVSSPNFSTVESTLHTTNFSIKTAIPEVKNVQVPISDTGNITPLLTDINLLNKSNVTDQVCFGTSVMSPVTSDKNSFSSILKPENNVLSKSVVQTPDATDVNAPKIVELTKTAERNDESLQKFKKASSVFDNDIQEIKYLIDNIEIGEKRDYFPDNENITKLKREMKKLKALNSDLCDEIDNIKASIIETFACVQDVKTKHFQLTNPGYKSLSNIQDLDPVNAIHLKNIENNINYVQGQLEKTDKQLDEIWCEFKGNSFKAAMKTPVLDNLFKTMDKQQKILNVLECRTENLYKNTEKLQKRLTVLNYGESGRSRMITERQMNSKIQSNDDSSLAELTQKILNINSGTDEHVDAKKLANLYSIEHAKRFHLSYTKQVKLQELYGTGSVTFIQSSRLQRLKKKSLIILSKTSCPVDEVRERSIPKMSPTTEEVRTDMISPVSVEENEITDKFTGYENVMSQNIISSTPIKNNLTAKHNVENIPLPEEPSIPASHPITHSFLTNDNVSGFPTESTLKPAESKFSSVILPTRSTTEISNGFKESPPVSVQTGTDNIFPAFSTQTFSAAIPFSKPFETPRFSSLTSTTTADSIEPMSNSVPDVGNVSFFGSVKPTLSTTPIDFSTTFATCTFATSPSNVGIATASKTEDSVIKTVSPASTMVSMFSGKASAQSSVPLIVSSATNFESSGSSFKTFSNISPSIPLFSNSTSATTLTTTTVAQTASQAVNTNERTILGNIQFPKDSRITINPVTNIGMNSATPTILGGTGSIFGKPNTSVSNTINFGSMISSTNPIFGTKAPTTVITPTDQKTETFSSFSFSNKNPTEAVVTITEISNDIKGAETISEANKENMVQMTNTTTIPLNTNVSITNSTFSFASIGSPLSFTPVKSDTYGTISSPPNVSVMPANISSTPASIANKNNNSVLFSALTTSLTTSNILTSVGSNVFSTAATTVPSAVPTVTLPSVGLTTAMPVISHPTTLTTTLTPTTPIPTPISTPASTIPKTNVSSVFENTSSSFFGNLNINSASTTTDTSPFGKPVSANASIFGGGNIFSQNTAMSGNTAAGISESKPIFGSGATSSLFGQTNASSPENKSLFSNFQNNRQSVFGSSSLFGSGSGFSNSAPSVTQTSSFSTTAPDGSVFRSNNTGFGSPQGTSLFQGASSSFGQQAQSTSGFGSPPAFSNIFNKTNSSFPAFGGNPTFGGSPMFGSSPTKVFGQTTQNLGTFGNPSIQQATVFENLAGENTVSFGNLAQQQSTGFGSPPTFGTNTGKTPPPAFGSSSFGGNSFSSWRS